MVTLVEALVMVVLACEDGDVDEAQNHFETMGGNGELFTRTLDILKHKRLVRGVHNRAGVVSLNPAWRQVFPHEGDL